MVGVIINRRPHQGKHILVAHQFRQSARCAWRTRAFVHVLAAPIGHQCGVFALPSAGKRHGSCGLRQC